MIYTLQGLRALAMLGIFLFHSGLLLNGTFPVTFFFILSGFVLYYSKYNRIENMNLKDRIKWTFNKIKPFYIIHIITFLLSIIIRWEWINTLTLNKLFKKLILNLLLIQSFCKNDAFSFNNLSWFLSVTFILYLVAIPLIKVIKKIAEKRLVIIMMVVLLVQYILNIINTNNIAELYLYSNPFYRVFDFLLGMISAKIFLNKKYITKNYNLWEFGIVVLFVTMYLLSFIIKTGCSYYSILFILALYVFSYEKGIISKILKIDMLQKIAKISFEFYMIHELILIVFRRAFVNLEYHWLIKNIIICIPAFIISLILAKMINKYITKTIKEKGGILKFQL